jgi:3-methyladenine DNA glycosylase/8-oxoguanine DNA glycosylase
VTRTTDPAETAYAALGAEPVLAPSGQRLRMTQSIRMVRRGTDRLDLDNLGALSDDEVVGVLTAVPGVGSWSAQALLLRQLRRPDIRHLEGALRSAITLIRSYAASPDAPAVNDRSLPGRSRTADQRVRGS